MIYLPSKSSSECRTQLFGTFSFDLLALLCDPFVLGFIVLVDPFGLGPEDDDDVAGAGGAVEVPAAGGLLVLLEC